MDGATESYHVSVSIGGNYLSRLQLPPGPLTFPHVFLDCQSVLRSRELATCGHHWQSWAWSKTISTVSLRQNRQASSLFAHLSSRSRSSYNHVHFGYASYIPIYGPVLRLSTPPMGWVPRYHPPFPSICKLLAAFLRSSFVFARSLQHFWLPASHLLGTYYFFGDLRSTHTPSKYPRDAYVLSIVIYTCAMYLLPIYYLCTLTTLHVFNI